MTLKLAPLAMVAIGLSIVSSAVISALRLDNAYLGYAICTCGLAAGFLQWRFLRRLNASLELRGRPTLFVQLYGLVFLTGLCSTPAILIGRALGGVDIWTGA
jgi:hypothetical protein